MIRKRFLLNMCRLCGLNKSKGTDICGASAKETGLLLQVNKCLSKEVVYISADDSLPKFICSECEMIIKKFEDFCNMVIDVQKRLEGEKLSFEETPQKCKSDSEADKPTFYPQQKGLNVNCTSVGNDATVSVGPDGKVECMLCQHFLEAVEHTTLHMVTHGIGTVICRCRVCGLQGELAQFLRGASDREDKSSVWCKSCQFLPPSKHKTDGRSQNRQTVTRKKHTCEMCSKVFPSRGHLSRHRIVHSGAKPFLCEVCGTGFSQKSSLKLHVLSHKGLYPFKCEQCGQAFRFKASLRSHAMNLHCVGGDNSNQCDRCNKQFATTYKLRRHYRSHTGERPYECTCCGRLFSQTGNLNLHRKKHLEEDPLLDTKQTAPVYENSLSKSNIPDTLVCKQTSNQFTVTILPSEQHEPPPVLAEFIVSDDSKFLETILQHPAVPCADLNVAGNSISTIGNVLLHSTEKETNTATFVPLKSEFGSSSAHISSPEYLPVVETGSSEAMPQKTSTELFSHFNDEGLLYIDQGSNLQDSTSNSEGVSLPTFSSLQPPGTSVSNSGS